MSKKQHAFTLIELLVVIAIIALLMAVIMPAMNKAKYLARRMVCTANIKNQALAQKTYASDYNGKFHSHTDSGPTYAKSTVGPNDRQHKDNLYLAMIGYVGDVEIMSCPILKAPPLRQSIYKANDWGGGWGAAYERDGNINNITGQYLWVANYKSKNDGKEPDYDFVDGRGVPSQGMPWPKNDSEASSQRAFIMHRVSFSIAGIGRYRDITHGSKKLLTESPEDDIFSSSVDNPIGLADGSVDINLKRDMKPRAKIREKTIFYY
ncbi:MAG: type II secretion system protein [Planctomycetota bacterium]